MPLTKKDAKRAARDRERFWQSHCDNLHAILDQTLREQRAPLESALLNGMAVTIGVRVLPQGVPEDVPAESATAPLVVLP